MHPGICLSVSGVLSSPAAIEQRPLHCAVPAHAMACLCLPVLPSTPAPLSPAIAVYACYACLALTHVGMFQPKRPFFELNKLNFINIGHPHFFQLNG